MKVLIMGLGLHGGGLETARYLLRHGAELTITDLRDEKTLAPSIEQLEEFNKGEVSPLASAAANAASSAPPLSGRALPPAKAKANRLSLIRYVLGRHEIGDFQAADMVIKNPGVRPDSPFLQAARTKGLVRIETDISLFLAALADTPVRLIAVTGSKGKSSTASAIHWALTHSGCPSHLGGNITVSPLAFLDSIKEEDNVVLELSSWQLGDIRGRRRTGGTALLKPAAAVITPIMPDHLDRYGTMEAYVNDKRIIYQGQDSGDLTVARDDYWGRSFLAETAARPLIYSAAPLPQGVCGGWIADPAGPGCARLSAAEGEIAEIVPARPLVPGLHQKQNLLAAGLALYGCLPPEAIRESLGSFPGVEHRLELFHQAGGIDFYNDSAATIPEAAAAALEALGSRKEPDGGGLILVAGGADKNLDFSPLVQAAPKAKAIVLLDGTASAVLRSLLADIGAAVHGPFDSLEKAVTVTLAMAEPGDRVVLSPGCASFGMFLNEFDRGKQWKDTVKRLSTNSANKRE